MAHKILLVDDSITIQKVVSLTFSSDEFQVVSFGSGTEALKNMDKVNPDIILLDVIMPDIKGYQVCEQIKRNPKFKDVPILLLTGTFEAFDEEEANRVGADGNITKPFDHQVIIERVRELLAQRKKVEPKSSAPVEQPVTAEPVVTEHGELEEEEEFLFSEDTVFEDTDLDGSEETKIFSTEMLSEGVGDDKVDETVIFKNVGDLDVMNMNDGNELDDTGELPDVKAKSVDDTQPGIQEFAAESSVPEDQAGIGEDVKSDEMVFQVDDDMDKVSEQVSAGESEQVEFDTFEPGSGEREESVSGSEETPLFDDDLKKTEENTGAIPQPGPEEEAGEHQFDEAASSAGMDEPVFEDAFEETSTPQPTGENTGEIKTTTTAAKVKETMPDIVKEETKPTKKTVPASTVDMASQGLGDLNEEFIEKVSQRVAEILVENLASKILEKIELAIPKKAEGLVEKIAWEVVPDLAEILIKKEIEEIQSKSTLNS